MAPPRSPRCPRCGFSFAWNGRTCGHCPPPERARQLWEQISHLPELVGSDKGISQRQLLAIASACLRRVELLLPYDGTADQLDDDLDAFARVWGQEAVRHLYMSDPRQLALTGLRLLACELATARTIKVPTVQMACAHWHRGVGGSVYPMRELLSYLLPPELEPYREAVAASLGTANDSVDMRSREEDDPVRAAFDVLRKEERTYYRQRWQAARVEEATQCAIARDVLGYPEVTVRFDPEWRTSTAVAITRGMYESRDFGGMPILADALQDAGCDEPEILEHCRADRLHVRGCWVCEWVLGMTES